MDRFLPLIEQFGIGVEGPGNDQRRTAFTGQAQRFGAEGRFITRPFRGRDFFHRFGKVPSYSLLFHPTISICAHSRPVT